MSFPNRMRWRTAYAPMHTCSVQCSTTSNANKNIVSRGKIHQMANAAMLLLSHTFWIEVKRACFACQWKLHKKIKLAYFVHPNEKCERIEPSGSRNNVQRAWTNLYVHFHLSHLCAINKSEIRCGGGWQAMHRDWLQSTFPIYPAHRASSPTSTQRP